MENITIIKTNVKSNENQLLTLTKLFCKYLKKEEEEKNANNKKG